MMLKKKLEDMKDYSQPKQTQYVAINNNEAMYLYSKEEALSYQEQGWVILEWKPIELKRTVLVIRHGDA